MSTEPLPRITLAPATTPEQVAAVRGLLVEYAQALGIDLEFQGFSAELAALPGLYAPPQGALWLAEVGGAAAGCVALRPLTPQVPPDLAAAEMKRLYVRPAFRQLGLGRRLVGAVVQAARAAGYCQIKLDTLATMAQAQALYRQLGFVEVPPYGSTHLPGMRFFALHMGANGSEGP